MTKYEQGVEVGEMLIGTCSTILGVLEQLGFEEELQNSSDFCTALDNTAYECEGCGWWFAAGDGQHDNESGTGWYCDDCVA